jgi:hypothetical protein
MYERFDAIIHLEKNVEQVMAIFEFE